MINRALPHIIVTGIPRTGTSFVTDVLHNELGVRMANTIGAPINNFFDYEDLEIGQMLIKHWNQRATFERIEKDVERYKEKQYAQYSSYKSWGFKSPLVLLFPFECIDPRSIVIKTKRDPSAYKSSLKKLVMSPTMSSFMHKLQKECEEHYRYVAADIIVDYTTNNYKRDNLKEFLYYEILRVKEAKLNSIK